MKSTFFYHYDFVDFLSPEKTMIHRGPNRCANLRSDKKTIVKINSKGQPIGKKARKFSSYLGLLARDGRLIPIDVRDWRKYMTKERKVDMWSIVEVYSNSCVFAILLVC